jgi:hypothetical protein
MKSKKMHKNKSSCKKVINNEKLKKIFKSIYDSVKKEVDNDLQKKTLLVWIKEYLSEDKHEYGEFKGKFTSLFRYIPDQSTLQRLIR